MQAFEGEQIYFTDQQFRMEAAEKIDIPKAMKKFIREFIYQNEYIYKTQLVSNATNGRFYLEVEIGDLNNFDHKLFEAISSSSYNLFEEGISDAYFDLTKKNEAFQMQLISHENPSLIRNLHSDHIGKLVTVQGIIISATKTQIKGKSVTIVCKFCNDEQHLLQENGVQGVTVPRVCLRQSAGEKCPMDGYVIVPEKSKMIDSQMLRIQELPELIPTGEIPRNFSVCCDRYLVNSMIPGHRVKISGFYSVRRDEAKGKNTKDLKSSYIYVLGVQPEKQREQQNSEYTEEMFQAMGKSERIYQNIQESIAPAIYGHEDIKLALACLLFGGSSKQLPDGMKLRGDINVLLIGDPSTAKSQMLKFIERASPVSVYTSGKGSSAAGLTATIQSQGNTFSLEAGALVLASGGVCCIDEFDKMRPEDRVAMHEAMEQQTISVAKAGITTRLNAKCSILAAANPIFGRYQENKSISDQIELQKTILSRFDCIFVVKDIRSNENDARMAQHIVKIHAMEEEKQSDKPQFELNLLKAYVKYAKSQPGPRLTNESATMIENMYVQDRQKSQSQKGHIPITVRQLEAIIRLSEALAKMQLKSEVEPHHVREAHRLFQNSTMMAVSMGVKELGLVPEELKNLVSQIEESIKRRVGIGSKISNQKLTEELVGRFNNAKAIEFAINQMVRNEDLQLIEHKRIIYRKK